MNRFDSLFQGLEQRGCRLDANNTAFMQKSLTGILTRVQETIFAAPTYEIFPMGPALGSGLTSIEYQQETEYGEMQLIGPNSSDLPKVDVFEVTNNKPVANYGASFGWSYIEMERAARQQRSLSERRAMKARKIAERKIDSVVWGESDDVKTDITGLFGYSLSAASGLTGGWASATETQILDDIGLILQAAYDGMSGEIVPDTLVLPADELGIIAYKMRANTDSTLLDIAKQKFGLKNVFGTPRLDSVTSSTNSLSAAPTAVAFQASNEVMELMIPRPFQLLPGQWDGMQYTVPFLLDFAGLFLYLPPSVGFGDLS